MRRGLLSISAAGVVLLAAVFAAGELLSAPARRAVGPPPPELAAQPVEMQTSSHQTIAGWFARGIPGQGAVLLLHGIRGDRRQMTERAKFLHTAGYSVLLVDLPAHGESGGSRITYGYREAAGVKAAMRFLRQTLPNERHAVIGISLGAASFVLADETPAPNAVVLESMYPTIAEAVSDRLRMRLGAWGAQLARSTVATADSSRRYCGSITANRPPASFARAHSHRERH